MLSDLLKDKRIVLGSASPRRRDLLRAIINDFEIKVSDLNEEYPKGLKEKEICEFLAIQKSEVLSIKIKKNEILITADTIVIKGDQILNKPKNKTQAKEMLVSLSDSSHKVITSVCLRDQQKKLVFSSITKVFFKSLSDAEINYYVEKYKPLDKAGSYGIQEWIGMIGITKIEGSYFNVVGLPIAKLYQKLIQFASL
jgi:septum formation protein